MRSRRHPGRVGGVVVIDPSARGGVALSPGLIAPAPIALDVDTAVPGPRSRSSHAEAYEKARRRTERRRRA